VATVVEVAARVAEIVRVGAERAEVTAEEVIRELKKLGFSCIGNVVDWHNETVETESEDGKGTKTVLVPRVTIIAKADLEMERDVRGMARETQFGPDSLYAAEGECGHQ
jgi:hypothetical protein